MAKLPALIIVVSLLLCNFSDVQAQKKKKKGPLDELKAQWGEFDFHFGDNWEVERMSTFLLKTSEFVTAYYEIIKDSVETDEELIQNDISLCQQYLIVEFNHQDLEKKVYDQEWDFELEVRDINKDRFKFEPLMVDTTEVLKGEEIMTGYKGFQPVTVVKKRGDIVQERITPTFWAVEKSNLWNRTYVIYFPATYPDSDVPILSDQTNIVEFDADTKGIISMTARWKFKDLPFDWKK